MHVKPSVFRNFNSIKVRLKLNGFMLNGQRVWHFNSIKVRLKHYAVA